MPTKIIPDRIQVIRTALKDLLSANVSATTRATVMELFRDILGDKEEGESNPIEDLLQAVRVACGTEDRRSKREEDQSLHLVATALFRNMRASFKQHPILNVVLEENPVLVKLAEDPNDDPDPGIEDMEDLIEVIRSYLLLPMKGLFHRVQMHAGYSTSDFINLVTEASDFANKLAAHGGSVTLFLDEFNTTSIMGYVKELIYDRRVEGRKFRQIF